MAATVSDDDSVGSLKLFVSKENMRLTDIDIWRRHISMSDKRKVSDIALITGQLQRPFTCFRKCVLAVYLVIYRAISIFYHVVYFYFAPFLITFILIYMNQIEEV